MAPWHTNLHDTCDDEHMFVACSPYIVSVKKLTHQVILRDINLETSVMQLSPNSLLLKRQ